MVAGGGRLSQSVAPRETDRGKGKPPDQLHRQQQQSHRSSSQSPPPSRRRRTPILDRRRSEGNSTDNGGASVSFADEEHHQQAEGGSEYETPGGSDDASRGVGYAPCTPTKPSAAKPDEERADARYDGARQGGSLFSPHRSYTNNTTSPLSWTRGAGQSPPILSPGSRPFPSTRRDGAAIPTTAGHRETHHGNNSYHNIGAAAKGRATRIGNGTGDDRWGGQGRAEDHIVLVTPSLCDVSTLVEALQAPQVPHMGFVVVCPMHAWRRHRDEEEMVKLQRFPEVGNMHAQILMRGNSFQMELAYSRTLP